MLCYCCGQYRKSWVKCNLHDVTKYIGVRVTSQEKNSYPQGEEQWIKI